jgi:hypothetical protein
LILTHTFNSCVIKKKIAEKIEQIIFGSEKKYYEGEACEHSFCLVPFNLQQILIKDAVTK